MDMDKIIEKLESQCDMVFNSPVDNSFKCGYKLCLGDLKELVEHESETPPCAGSSVQSNKVDSEKLYDFCETLKNFNKAVNDKNKKLHEWITYDINIGDDVKLKDGTIGKINYAGRLHKHDEYEWYFVIAIEKGKTLCLYSYDLSKNFQQIGRYNFHSEDKQSNIDKLKLDFKKVTEPATVTTVDGKGNVTLEFNKMTESYHKTPPTNEQLMNKINEIINVINKL